MEPTSEMFTEAADVPVRALLGDVIEWIPADATLSDAARRLTTDGISALVVGDGTTPFGIVTERDLVHAIAERRDPATARLADSGSTDLVWCDVDATVSEVGAEMMRHYVRHVLVEEDGRLLGIVSARDLLGVLTDGDL